MPMRILRAAVAASANAGSFGAVGSAQPWATIQVERSLPPTVQRAVRDFCLLDGGTWHVTARPWISRINAPRARAYRDIVSAKPVYCTVIRKNNPNIP